MDDDLEDEDLNNSSTDGQELSINRSDCDGEQEDDLNNFEDEDFEFCEHLNNDSKKVNSNANSSYYNESDNDSEIYVVDGNEDHLVSCLRRRRRTVTSATNDRRRVDLRKKSGGNESESCYSGYSQFSDDFGSDRELVNLARMRLGILRGQNGGITVEVSRDDYNIENHELFERIFYLTQEQLDSLNRYVQPTFTR